MTGIYQIQSISHPERIYIGSAMNIKDRWQLHLCHLRSNQHHSKKLQNHYNKYGEVDLIFSILYDCSKDKLIYEEQFFINCLEPFFNICKIAGSCIGIKREKFTEIHIKNLSESHKGKKSHLGISHSQETKNNISKNHADVSGINNPSFGKKRSKESREKMSISHIGLQSGENHPMYNKTHSEESKKKMRESRINYLNNLKTKPV